MYIGQTKNTLKYRKNQHAREARCNKRPTVYFHNALNKYGIDNFTFEQIDQANTHEDLNEKERYWIQYYNSNNKMFGYNLDSGGNSQGEKSEETKKKIGLTTKEKWKDPITAKKMRDGLLKGTETMKQNIKKYPIGCPVCKQIFYYPQHIANSKKFCSLECSARARTWEKGVDAAATKTHLKNLRLKSTIKHKIEEWTLENRSLVLNCPYNKIVPTLQPLLDLMQVEYGIKDIRSLFACYENVKSKKEFLNALKHVIDISKENVC